MAKRRGSGEGSVFQDKDGVWWGSIDLGYKVVSVDGKIVRRRQRRKKRCVSRKDAREQVRVMQAEVERGQSAGSDRQTVDHFLTRWIEAVRPTLRPKSFGLYHWICTSHLLPALGSIMLTKLSSEHVEALMQACEQVGYSATTIRQIRTILRIALNYAMRQQLVPRNVVMLTSPPRVERRDVPTFTPGQAHAFVAAVRGDRLEALYTVALALGVRQGEALALRWVDVDLERATVRVNGTLQRVNGKLVVTEPKTQQSRRTIALPDAVVQVLRLHAARQAMERHDAGRHWQENGYVFATPRGRPQERSHVHQHLQELLDRAGLPRMRFHDLRHCCASLLLTQNVHPKIVQDLLGHSQISMTMDTYSHVLPQTRREAASRMDDLLANAQFTIALAP